MEKFKKEKIKRIILEGIKNRTLFYDIIGFILILLGFADNYLAVQNIRYKVYSNIKNKMKKEIKEELENNKFSEEKKDGKNCIWVCWLQGIENAPELVKTCFNSLKYWVKDKEIIVITEKNLEEYTNFPSYIKEKYKKGIISRTHFSDLIRLELLTKYGGIWIDATTYITGPLPDYLNQNDLFLFRNGWINSELLNTANWFISSKKINNVILLKTKRLLFKYWEKNDYLKNYFIMHIILKIVTDYYKEEWERVPNINHIDSHFLAEELLKPYNEERCKSILKLTSIHKLTYKFNLDLSNEENITLKKLDMLYLEEEK